jgi:tellurium resistance protein TerZ
LTTADGALKHTGDDLAGDAGGDDCLDNEIITVNLSRISSSVGQIFFFVNNCGKEDFSMIPYAKIRMFEGTAARVKEVFASYNVAAEPKFKGKCALILGRLYRKGSEWKFNAIGEPTDDVFVGQTVVRIAKEYNNM